jgi:hypothetical protein
MNKKNTKKEESKAIPVREALEAYSVVRCQSHIA